MKYPIGIQSFGQIIEDGYVYVDKTDLVYQLVTSGSIYLITFSLRHWLGDIPVFCLKMRESLIWWCSIKVSSFR